MSSHALFRTPNSSPDLGSSFENVSLETTPRKKKKSGSFCQEKNNSKPSGSGVSRTKNIPSTEKKKINSSTSSESRYLKKSTEYDSIERSDTDDSCSTPPEKENGVSLNYSVQFGGPSARLPYTRKEDEMILKFVLKNENIFRTTSISLWKQLEFKMMSYKRTYQSLKNRFLRVIRPKLFTDYRNFISDKKVEKKILEKFPELKKSYRNTKPPLNCVKKSPKTKDPYQFPRDEPPNRSEKEDESSQKEDGSVEEEDRSSRKEVCQNAIVNSYRLLRPCNIFGTEPHSRKVKMEKKSLTVTFEVDHSSSKNQTFQTTGIYEKYLDLKKNNVLPPCPRCGQANDLTNDSTDDEGRLVIDCSFESTPKKSSDRSKTPSPNPKKKRKKGKHSNSPSLLSYIYRQSRSKTPDVVSASNAPPAYKETPNRYQDSEELINDVELDKLYNVTVAHCHELMDSDDDEKSESYIREMMKKNPKCLQPVVSLEKINVESFFFNSESQLSISSSESVSSSSGLSLECNNQTIKIKNQNLQEKPLAKNMIKMFKK